MNPEKQRIALAEFAGWKQITKCQRNLKPNPQGVELCGIDPNGDTKSGGYEWAFLPNYLNDLNAIHEVEKLLTDEQYKEYEKQLYLICSRDKTIRFVSLTASQRAEALLRTLNLGIEEE